MANFLSMFCEKKVKIRESVDVLFRRGWMTMDKETSMKCNSESGSIFFFHHWFIR